MKSTRWALVAGAVTLAGGLVVAPIALASPSGTPGVSNPELTPAENDGQEATSTTSSAKPTTPPSGRDLPSTSVPPSFSTTTATTPGSASSTSTPESATPESTPASTTPQSTIPSTQSSALQFNDQDLVATIERLTGTDGLTPVSEDPSAGTLPRTDNPVATLPSNKIGGFVLYHLPDGSNTGAPARESSTVAFRAVDGSFDAFQSTAVGQLRQIVSLVPGAESTSRRVELVGDVSIKESGDSQFVLLNDQGATIAVLTNFKARTVDGKEVPANLTLNSGALVVSISASVNVPVVASWSYAAASDAGEVTLP